MEFQFQFDWQAAIDSIPFLIKGIPYTLLISFGGLLIGFALGIVFGLLSINKKWFLRWPATAYIEIFRGTPILVQVLFIFYGLPDLIGGPIDPLTAGIAAIALNSGAYISEVVRGGVQSIDQAIVSIKDTSLFSVIGVGELVRQGQIYIANTFTAFEVYFVVAILYLAITLSLSLILRFVERRGLASV